MTDRGIEYRFEAIRNDVSPDSLHAFLQEPVRGMRVGDEIYVFEVPGAPENLRGRTGTVTSIDEKGMLHGTWDSEWGIVPGVDVFERIEDLKKAYIEKHPEIVEGMTPVREPDTIAKKLFYEELRRNGKTAYYAGFEDLVSERLDRLEVVTSKLLESVEALSAVTANQKDILQKLLVQGVETNRRIAEGFEESADAAEASGRALKRLAALSESNNELLKRIADASESMVHGVTVAAWKARDVVVTT